MTRNFVPRWKIERRTVVMKKDAARVYLAATVWILLTFVTPFATPSPSM